MPSDTGLRHAKVVCTLGPASDDVKAIGALIDGGMDVARLIVSHDTHATHTRRVVIEPGVARAARGEGALRSTRQIQFKRVDWVSLNGATSASKRSPAGVTI
jgi:hypothetical protein